MEDEVVPVEGQTAPVITPKLEPSDDLPGIVEEPTIEPAATTEEPFMQFKTQAEYEAWAETERQKLVPQEEPTEEPSEGLFKNGEQPEDWREVIEVAKREVKKEDERKSQLAAKTNQLFDQQYEQFAQKKGLPSLTTAEGQELNKQITSFGVKFKQQTMADAAELWSVVPKEHGGGLSYTAPKVHSSNPNRAVSAKIGGGSGNTNPAKQGRSYAELHGKDIDTLIQEDLGE